MFSLLLSAAHAIVESASCRARPLFFHNHQFDAQRKFKRKRCATVDIRCVDADPAEDRGKNGNCSELLYQVFVLRISMFAQLCFRFPADISTPLRSTSMCSQQRSTVLSLPSGSATILHTRERSRVTRSYLEEKVGMHTSEPNRQSRYKKTASFLKHVLAHALNCTFACQQI